MGNTRRGIVFFMYEYVKKKQVGHLFFSNTKYLLLLIKTTCIQVMTETMVVFRSLISLKCKIIKIHSTMSSHQHNTSIQNHTQNEAIRSAIPGAHKTKLIIERVARAQTVCVCARARSRWPPQPHRRGGAFIQV